MTSFRTAFGAALTLAFALSIGSSASAQSASERNLEARLIAVPMASDALAIARTIDARAHYPGTPGDYALAVAMRDRLRDDGFDARLEPYSGRIDTPLNLGLVLEAKLGISYVFDLREKAGGPHSAGARPDAGIPFNYGSGDGDVRAPLVYANRGLDADYAALRAAGLDVRGKIVLVRYGAEFRGLLAVRALRAGVAAVVFYSDPKDDGPARGPAYPRGPWRPLGAVQRGMVSAQPLAIPTLPISAANAQVLLQAIVGRAAPAAWRGGLPLVYKIGQTTDNVHLTVRLRRSVETMWNTVGRLRGRGDGEVLLGGHRDAWVYGVTDNGSGITTLLEAARALGALHRTGWTPRRSIVIAGWDAEEIGELGSQAFVKAHARELRSNAIAYINADENVTGTHFEADAAAALGHVLVDATRTVSLPGSAGSIRSRWSGKPDPPGGGSDHESFLFGLGIPTAEAGFAGPFGVYHSAYDDFAYATSQADPGFRYHEVVGRLLGVLALRLADAPNVPYRFTPYGATLGNGLHALALRARTQRLRVDLGELREAITRFGAAAKRYDNQLSRGVPTHAAPALVAVQLLDRMTYGAVGYAHTIFPALGAAIDASDAFAARKTVHATATTLRHAAALLHV